LASSFACRRGEERGPSGPGLSITGNAIKGGLNSQRAEWFEEELPGLERELAVKVSFLPAGLNDQDYKARLALDIRSGRGADVMVIDQFWVPEFAAADFLMPLDRYYREWPLRDEFFKPIQEMGSFGGHKFMVVWDADVRMIFYNRDLLARAGIELPWQPRSWEDLIEAGRRIKAACPGVIPLQVNAGTVMGEAATMQGFLMLLHGAGGRLYDEDRGAWVVDSPALRRTLEFYRRVYQVEKLGDPGLQVSLRAREKSFELMSREKIAIYLESTWFYNSVLDPNNESWGMADRDRKIGWALMPGAGGPGDPEFVSVSGGDGLIINPLCQNPDLAWELIAALNDLDRQKRQFAKKPFTPTRRDLAALPEVRAHEFISQAASRVMPWTTFRPALPEYPEISFHVQHLTERVVTGQFDIDRALAEFGRAVENIVGRERTVRIGR